MTVAHSLQIRTLRARPTIETRNCCDLKIMESDGTRHWLCRYPVGRTDHRIIIETYDAATASYVVSAVFTDEEPT